MGPYASLSWGHITRFPSKHSALDKFNRLAATLITPVRCSTPIKTIELLYDLIPLHLKYEAIASLSCNTHCLSLTGLGHNPSCKTYIGHRKFWTNALATAHLSVSSVDRIHDLNWHKTYHIALNSLNSNSFPNQYFYRWQTQHLCVGWFYCHR